MQNGETTDYTPIAIEEEMKHSFMSYAMSVIVSRALPDARDGLKPVHRRILFAQSKLSNTWNRPYVKCARIVGNVIGNYHPHGDSAVYDALVRMAQDFSMRYMLIDGQGNFGSVDGDPPAAMRYTECRMNRITSELLADLDKETVDHQLTYDDKEYEPKVLPTRIPNMLLNGTTGIAVGMATNIPPHNLGELIDGTLALIANPELPDEELFTLIPGPDFPTGGIIQGRQGIRAAHKLGRGSIAIRGRAEIEEIRKGRFAVVVTELPFMVNKSRWIQAMAAQVRDKKLDGISDIRDESDRTGMRAVIELKKNANEQVVLNKLYKQTALQNTFSANMLAIVNGRPKVLNLRESLKVFIGHRREVVNRRSQYDLRKAKERREIVEGLGLATMQIDRVIEIIRSSKDTDEAKTRLIAEKMKGLEGFLERAGRPDEEVQAARDAGFVYLTERQAQSILDMRLGKLTGLEREKLAAEYKELWVTTDYLEGILTDESKLLGVIIDELTEIKTMYADPRRTEIADTAGEIMTEELIAQEDMVVTRSHMAYVKRTPVSEYSAQGRGGRGIKGAESADDDFIVDMFVASTHDHLLMFTTEGRVYSKKVFELPSGGRTSKGRPVQNVVELQDDERVVGMLAVKEFGDDEFIFMATKSGKVKKTAAKAFSKIRVNGIIAIGIEAGDRLVDVRLTHGDMDVLLVTKNGNSIRFQEDQVRPMGREARGVRGISLREGDECVGMSAFPADSTDALLTICANGYGKRTSLSEYPTKNRGGIGVINIRTPDRNGPVSGNRIVKDDDHIILISNRGKIIRMHASDVSMQGRATQGVRVMRVGKEETVVSVESVADPSEDDEARISQSEIVANLETGPVPTIDSTDVEASDEGEADGEADGDADGDGEAESEGGADADAEETDSE